MFSPNFLLLVDFRCFPIVSLLISLIKPLTLNRMDTPVLPMGQPRLHYSLVNYSSSEDDFVIVLDSDEDENEGDENDGFENDSFEEEGVEDEGFGQACQSFIGDYSPFADEDFDQGQNAIDDYYNFDEDYNQGQNAIDYGLLIDEDFDQGQNAVDDYSLPLNEDSDQGQNAPVYLPMISNLLPRYPTPYPTPIATMNNRDTGQIFHHLQKAHIILQMKPVPPSIALRQCMDMRYQ